jgi:hypothetical protein
VVFEEGCLKLHCDVEYHNRSVRGGVGVVGASRKLHRQAYQVAFARWEWENGYFQSFAVNSK